ncbi:MAG TPA: site-2 protease family protein, partial [Nitrospiria bacterium]
MAAVPILFAIVLHEIAHGWVADKKGDPTARLMGRLTLNPLPHIDLIGTVLMPIVLLVVSKGSFMFGYAKPVPVNFMNLRRPKQDMVWVAAAGPITNVILAVVCGALLRLIVMVNPKVALYIQIQSQPRDWSDPMTMILLP